MDPRIVRTLATIEAAPSRCVKVSELAAQVGLSRSRFEHLFKEQTGRTLKSRLRRLRLNRAKSPLADCSLSIKEVGAQSGYSSPSSFTRDFRKFFQVSPSQCRHSTF
jgi:AraC family transcriptional regulator of arabinose operon